MGMASLPGGFGIAVLGLALSACSKPVGTAGPAGDGSGPAGAARIDCVHVGAMGCNVDATQDLKGQACDQLQACLADVLPSDDSIRPPLSCDPPSLPSSDGSVAVAAVAVSLDHEGVPSHAGYLFVRGDPGWCPGYELLAPQWNHGGYCEADFSFEWLTPRDGDGDTRLSITSSRVCYMPLDQGEIAGGESDIASQDCSRTAFDLVNGQLLPVARLDDESNCQTPTASLAGGK